MSGGVLGVAGDILSVAFFCFICSLAVQLYCAFRRRQAMSRPLTPFHGAAVRSPAPPHPHQAAASPKHMHVSRFQRSASCPVVSAIAPPPSPPQKLSSAHNVSPTGSSGNLSPGNVSPLACNVASQAHVVDLAKLMQLERAQEQEGNAIRIPPQRLLFPIKEEGKDEDATEHSAEATYCAVELVVMEGQAKWTSTTCAHPPAAGGLVKQVSSASSDGGLSLWSTSSPCPSSPAVSYLSASSSPFPTSSPPRSSSWAQTSRFSSAAS